MPHPDDLPGIHPEFYDDLADSFYREDPDRDPHDDDEADRSWFEPNDDPPPDPRDLDHMNGRDDDPEDPEPRTVSDDPSAHPREYTTLAMSDGRVVTVETIESFARRYPEGTGADPDGGGFAPPTITAHDDSEPLVLGGGLAAWVAGPIGTVEDAPSTVAGSDEH